MLTQIEEACRVNIEDGLSTKIQRLGDITQSMQGIIPYKTKAEGTSNLYIRPQVEVPLNELEWKPLLDGSGFVGRYEMLWGKSHPFLKYGKWLWCPREPKYFTSAKLIVQYMRNRALKRRIVATYDDTGIYNRHNFSNIIAGDPIYELKYILALFNSSLLNYWYARHYDNVNINPDYFRTLPIYPASTAAQSEIIVQVDRLLEKHAALNALREQGYIICTHRDGTHEIVIPYDVLLGQMKDADPNLPLFSLYDAQAVGLLRLPVQCDQAAQISRVFTPNKFPNTVVLRTSKLWLEVDDADIRRFLLNYLDRPQWKCRSWDEISTIALLPETPAALTAFFTEEARITAGIRKALEVVASADTEIDRRVLDLYGITDPADRQQILGSAPVGDDIETELEDSGEEEVSSSESVAD